MALETVGGMTVAACASGQDAIAQFATFQPDVVLLDVMMPDMDGPSVLRALRADPAGSDIPVIFLTAKVRPEEVLRLKREGAEEVFAKPFNSMTLANQICAVHQAVADRRAREAADAMSDKTADLRARFLERLKAERSVLAERVRALSSATTDAPATSDLAERAHRIAGTAGTVGLSEIARAASALEEALEVGDLKEAEGAGVDLLNHLNGGTEAE